VLKKTSINAFFAFLIRQLPLILLSILVLFPIYFLFVTSFKTKYEYLFNKLWLPSHPTLSNFIQALHGKDFILWFMNSAILTFGGVIIGTIVASLAAYAFSHMDFWKKQTFLNILISLMAIPPIVMVTPLFVLMVKMNLINTYPSAIIIYVGLTLPFSIYLLNSFFVTIPRSITEAAIIDGCSTFQVFTKIILPLSKSALVTLILVNGTWIWNELLIALIFLQSNYMRTLMVGLTVFRSRYNINIPVTMSGMAMAVLPMIILYLLTQKYFIKGLTAGAIKE